MPLKDKIIEFCAGSLLIIIILSMFIFFPIDNHCVCQNSTIKTYTIGFWNLQKDCDKLCEKYGGGTFCPGSDLGCHLKPYNATGKK